MPEVQPLESDGYEAFFEDGEEEVFGSPDDAVDADAVEGCGIAEGDPSEGAATNRLGICRLKSTDQLETQAFLCDTQAGIECDLQLPETLPMEVQEHAPVLHRTSGVVPKDDDMPPPVEVPSKGPNVIEEFVYPSPSQDRADSEALSQGSRPECFVIDDSDQDSPGRPSGSTNLSPHDRMDMYAQMISKLESRLVEVSGSGDSAVVTESFTASSSSGHG